MNRVTITLTIDLPDGVTPSVDYGVAAEPLQLVHEAVAAATAPVGPPHIAETFKPFSPAAESWAPGGCPKHLKPWKAGNYGPYCTAKDDTGPKGYCVLKPGDIWNGKNIPIVPTGPAAPVPAA